MVTFFVSYCLHAAESLFIILKVVPVLVIMNKEVDLKQVLQLYFFDSSIAL